jgi:hypothetical protein
MFLENTSSGTLKVERLESQIIYKSLGVIKPNSLNRITNWTLYDQLSFIYRLKWYVLFIELLICHIADYCTGITCCTDVDLIGRSITTSVDLDVCDYTLQVKIEKLSVSISLVDYQFNKKDQVYLFGAIRLE